MKHLRLYEEFSRKKFCIKNHDGKFITARFTPGNGNVPSWTDNRELAYTYDTEDEAEDAAQALVNSGFVESDGYEVKPFDEILKFKRGDRVKDKEGQVGRVVKFNPDEKSNRNTTFPGGQVEVIYDGGKGEKQGTYIEPGNSLTVING